jgi:flagellar biosynthetic protein FliP
MSRHRFVIFATLAAMILLPCIAQAAPGGIDAFAVVPDGKGGQKYSVTIQILALMTALTFLPAILLSMSSFTRIMIVLAILRQALGTAQTPNNQVLLGLSLFLTLFTMAPVLDRVNEQALQPYLKEEIADSVALDRALAPFRQFMLRQTRESDLELFVRISGKTALESPEQTPFTLLAPAFLTSELKTAFQMGFLLFLPFLIIDLVVATILMSMGMMMLSPMVISLPFKLMLFVLVDGWALVVETLAASFFIE